MDLRRRLRGSAARRGIVAVGVLLVLHAVAAGSLVLLQRADAEVVLDGTVVADRHVGGLERAQLRNSVTERAQELLDEPVRVTVTDADADDTGADRTAAQATGTSTGTSTEAPSGSELVTDRRSIGVTADADAAVDAAWSLGRRGLWRALVDQLRMRAGAQRDVTLPSEIDTNRLERWSTATADVLSIEPRPAQVDLVATEPPDRTRIDVTPPTPGARVSAEELRQAARADHGLPGTFTIRASRQPIPAATGDADLDAALAAVEVVRSGPITLRNLSLGTDVTLTPTDLAAVVSVGFDPNAPDGQRLPIVADPDDLLGHLGDQRKDIDTDADDARVELDEGRLRIVGGTSGFRLDPHRAAEQVVATSLRADDRDAALPGATVAPNPNLAAVQRAVVAAGLDVSSPIILTNGASGDDLEVSPDQLTDVLEVAFDPAAEGPGQLTVTGDGDRLVEVLDDDALAAIETAPTEPQFTVSEDAVSIRPGEPGAMLDADAAARRLAELATTPGPRSGRLPMVALDPDLGDDEAREFGIQEEVSSFTTSMVAGQARNTNIRQAADYLDGSLIPPGERLSLNDAIGRRTTSRGFGEGGFIRDGEIVEVVGGGVSQMATTFMNAAWFAGIELVTFQPHSLYFRQYPIGRESTMSGNTIDVVAENDSPHGILVTTDHSDTHVTVSFWSTGWAEVNTWTGEPTNRVPGDLRDGFDIAFGRTITYPDGTDRSERYAHRYRPENAP